MAGVAGALYVPQVGIINPSEFSPATSIEVVVWVAVGGRGTLVGAALGAIVVNYLKTVFTTGMLAPYWLFLLGGLFIAITLLLPKGIVGTASEWWAAHRRRRHADEAGDAGNGDTLAKSRRPERVAVPGSTAAPRGSLRVQPAE